MYVHYLHLNTQYHVKGTKASSQLQVLLQVKCCSVQKVDTLGTRLYKLGYIR